MSNTPIVIDSAKLDEEADRLDELEANAMEALENAERRLDAIQTEKEAYHQTLIAIRRFSMSTGESVVSARGPLSGVSAAVAAMRFVERNRGRTMKVKEALDEMRALGWQGEDNSGQGAISKLGRTGLITRVTKGTYRFEPDADLVAARGDEVVIESHGRFGRAGEAP